MDTKGSFPESTNVINVKTHRNKKMIQGLANRTLTGGILTILIAVVAFIAGCVLADMIGLTRSPMRTRLSQVMNGETMPSNTWMNGPIKSANGYKTLVAQFAWADGFQMKNDNNYAVAWFDDPTGKQVIGITQFGQGVMPYQNQEILVIAPYYRVQVKNTDSVAHNINAWAYLMSN